jgi:hypothetical protein
MLTSASHTENETYENTMPCHNCEYSSSFDSGSYFCTNRQIYLDNGGGGDAESPIVAIESEADFNCSEFEFKPDKFILDFTDINY